MVGAGCFLAGGYGLERVFQQALAASTKNRSTPDAATTGPNLVVCSEHPTSTLSTMASMENRQQTFPAIPPSFSAGGHEMRDYYATSSAPQPSPNQNPYLTPYLGLRARLSQVWINRWTILLLLVLVRVLIAIASADDLLDDARDQALSACQAVEKAGSTMVSIPYYASQGFNAMTATGVEKAVNGLRSMVTMVISGVEEMIVFYIGMLTNTYLCLITLAVSGSMQLVVAALTAAQDDLNKALGDISNDIGGLAGNLEKGISSLLGGINSVLGSNNPPKVDFSGPINKLNNLKLPTGFSDSIKKLNDSIPTFADVKNITESVIRLPFEEVKKLVNTVWGNYTFNQSLLPIPQKETLNLCEGNPKFNNFFDSLNQLMQKLKNTFIGVLLTLALLACVPMAWLEIRRFHKLQNRSKIVDQFATDRMDMAYLVSRPYSSDFGRLAANKVSSTKSQMLVRWCVAYFTSVPALFLLSLAIAGFFSCLCRIIILRAIQKEVPNLTAQVADFTGEIVLKLNNASASWATETNAVIIREGTELNQELFGWVNTSTSAVNMTLNRFVDETINVLNITFGGTPLYNPIKEVFNCLIGYKIAGIQQGLTWVHDNAHIDFPLFANDTLTGGAILSKASPDSKAMFSDTKGATGDDISRVINKVVSKIESGIRTEAIISTMILVAWLIIFLSGLIAAIVRLRSRDKLRGEGGNEYNNHTQGSSFSMEPPPPPSPMGPAPAYSTTHRDVSNNAPYTLNPHPIPRSSFDDYEPEKRTPHDNRDAYPPPSRSQNPYNNEKSNTFI